MRIGAENIDLRNNDSRDVPKAYKTFKYFKQQQFAVAILFEYPRWLGEGRNFEEERHGAQGKKRKVRLLGTI